MPGFLSGVGYRIRCSVWAPPDTRQGVTISEAKGGFPPDALDSWLDVAAPAHATEYPCMPLSSPPTLQGKRSGSAFSSLSLVDLRRVINWAQGTKGTGFGLEVVT